MTNRVKQSAKVSSIIVSKNQADEFVSNLFIQAKLIQQGSLLSVDEVEKLLILTDSLQQYFVSRKEETIKKHLKRLTRITNEIDATLTFLESFRKIFSGHPARAA